MQHFDRFQNDFGMVEDDDTNTEEELKTQSKLSSKGADWNELFGPNKNPDDEFKLGISFFTKKNKITTRLYSEFYNSDIIVCSPLGLRMATGEANSEDYDVDFLSSIEVCSVMHSDVLLMQVREGGRSRSGAEGRATSENFMDILLTHSIHFAPSSLGACAELGSRQHSLKTAKFEAQEGQRNRFFARSRVLPQWQ